MRTGRPFSARYRFASSGVWCVKWNIAAAATADTRASVRTLAMCSYEPAPPAAMTGFWTADEDLAGTEPFGPTAHLHWIKTSRARSGAGPRFAPTIGTSRVHRHHHALRPETVGLCRSCAHSSGGHEPHDLRAVALHGRNPPSSPASSQ